MGDLLTIGMEHVVVAIPHVVVSGARALLDDLLQSLERRGEIGDGDDVARTSVGELVGHLASRVLPTT